MRQSPTNYLLLAAFTLAEAVLAWHPKELFGFLKCQSKDPQTLEVPIDFLKRMASVVVQMRKKHPVLCLEETGRFQIRGLLGISVQRTWFQNELSVVFGV